jgi:hypothetical protein
MTSIIRNRAVQLATFRSVSVQLMEMLAHWVPTTPEMEPKVLFGRHIWDFAQHADLLGRRTFELRAPLHFTSPPTAAYQGILAEVSAAKHAPDRIALLYTGLLPGLARRYHHYLDTADQLLDEPSVRIIERISVDIARVLKESRELSAQAPQFEPADLRHALDLADRERAVTSLVEAECGERRRSA